MAQEETSSASLRTSLLHSFHHLFVQQHCEEDIRNVMNALEKNKPIAELINGSRGTFSTIFLPFHIGNERVRKIAETHPQLRAFCTLAGDIEGLTDTMSLEGEEPAEEEKRKLLPLLEEFLRILPDEKHFRQWLSGEE